MKLLPLSLALTVALAATAMAQPASATTAADAPTRTLGSLTFSPCSLKAEGLPRSVEAQCTTMQVPENRADPSGRKIELAIAWIPNQAEAEPDPLFMIAGGPGQSALEAYPMLHSAFSDVRRSRDIMLVDARGTGGSHPLVCRDTEGAANLTEEGDQSIDVARAFAERCAAELSKDADLRFYSTSEHIDDLEDVRKAIGAEQINLIGISYGTRVAQQYAGRYPQSTRSVVLDSVVPNSLVLGSEHAMNLEATLNQQFARCVEIDACRDGMGSPREHLDSVRRALESGELGPVAYRDARSGEWKEAVPRPGHLAVLLRLYAYAPQTASLLPYLLSEAAQGRFGPMLAQSTLISGSLTEQIYHGMQLSVMCTEDVDEMQERAEDEATVLGNALITFTKAQCAVWPKGTRDPRFREPLGGDVPVLAISGEFDPVTPPRYGEEAVSHLANGRHLLLKGQGHSVVGLGCMPKLFAQFVEKPDPKALDASCLDRLRPLPPFTGPHGWEP